MSWRAPGSILEAPGSILEAPRPHLGGFWNDFFEIFGQNAKKVIGGFLKTFPPIAKNAKNLPKQDLDHKCAKSGWAAVLPPPGGFQWNWGQVGHFGVQKFTL